MPDPTHIPNHLYISIINGHDAWLAPLLGVAGLIVGALITGGLSLYKDHYRHKKKKLATAYAFKGEISALLDIIEKRQYIAELEDKIESLKIAVEKLKELGCGKYVNKPDEFKVLVKNLGTTPFFRFAFAVNDDVFYVINSLKGDIGLLDDVSVPVIKFYEMVKALILDLIENKKSNYEIDAKFWKIPEEKILDNLYSFYSFFNVYAIAEINLKHHKSMLEISGTLIESGKQSIEELDKFIKKNDFGCKRIILNQVS